MGKARYEAHVASRTNPGIACLFPLNPKMVRNDTANIFARLQVAGCTEAILRARDAGLGE